MRKFTLWAVSLALFSLLLGGCGALQPGNASDADGEVLPTTTPEPVEPTAEPTATPLPPPTVTPFPTVTPEGGVPAEGEETPEGEEAPAGEETPEAAPAGGGDEQPTQAVAGIPAEVPVGQRLYIADFTSGAWHTIDSDSAVVEQALNGYLWEIGPVDAVWINTGTLDLENFYAQVQIDVQRCPLDANYGLRFRLESDAAFYAYLVWCNDTYSAGSEMEGVHGTMIPRSELPPSQAGKAESQRVLGVLAQGATFTLFLDGVLLDEFENGELASGDLAMWARAGEGNLRVLWDNLEVYELR